MTTATVIAGFLQLTVLCIIYIMWLMRDKHKLEILQCEISGIKNDISARVDHMQSDINLHIYNNGHHKLSEAQETAINNFEESMNKNNKMVSSAVEWMTERFMATDAVVKAIGCRVDALDHSAHSHNEAMTIMNDRMSCQKKLIDCLGEEVKTTTDSLDRTIDHVSVRVDKLTEGEDAKKHDFNSIIERLGKLEAR